MFKMTNLIYDVLKKENLKIFTEETDKNSHVWLQITLKNGTGYRMKFISSSDDNDVAVRVFGLVNVEKSKADKILPLLNSFNNKYRYVKFIYDDDGDVNVEYDFFANCEHPEKAAVEVVYRTNSIIEDCYPELMRAIWA